MKKIFFALMLSLQIFLGAMVVSQAFVPAGVSAETKDLSIGFKLDNPLGKTASIQEFLVKVLDAVVLILSPIIVLMLIYSGFLFVAAQGVPEKIGEAKRTLLYTLIGAAIVLGAKGISLAIAATIRSIAS